AAPRPGDARPGPTGRTAGAADRPAPSCRRPGSTSGESIERIASPHPPPRSAGIRSKCRGVDAENAAPIRPTWGRIPGFHGAVALGAGSGPPAGAGTAGLRGPACAGVTAGSGAADGISAAGAAAYPRSPSMPGSAPRADARARRREAPAASRVAARQNASTDRDRECMTAFLTMATSGGRRTGVTFVRARGSEREMDRGIGDLQLQSTVLRCLAAEDRVRDPQGELARLGVVAVGEEDHRGTAFRPADDDVAESNGFAGVPHGVSRDAPAEAVVDLRVDRFHPGREREREGRLGEEAIVVQRRVPLRQVLDRGIDAAVPERSEEHTSELQSRENL